MIGTLNGVTPLSVSIIFQVMNLSHCFYELMRRGYITEYLTLSLIAVQNGQRRGLFQ